MTRKRGTPPVLSETSVADDARRVEGPKPAGTARLILLAAWRGVAELYNSDGLTHAASIAYYTLLSFFPMMLLGLFVLGEMTTDAADRDAVVRFVFRYFPGQFGFISGQLDAFQTQPVSFGFWGVVALIWASLGVFNAITSAVNHAWAVEKRRSFLKHRLVGFVMMVSAGLVLMLGLVIASLVRLAETRVGEVLARSPWLDNLSGAFASYLATRAADRLCRAGVLFHPEHEGPVPRCVAGRDSRRRACGASRCGSSRGTPPISRHGT